MERSKLVSEQSGADSEFQGNNLSLSSSDIGTEEYPPNDVAENCSIAPAKTDSDSELQYTVSVSDLVADVRDKLITETEDLKYNVERVFLNLNRSMLDSVIVSGYSGTGVTTVIEYFSQRVGLSKCPAKFHDAKVIEISKESFTEDMSKLDIFNIIVSAISFWYENGASKFILVFDDFEEFPEVFMDNYDYILDCVKNGLQFDLFKVVIGIKKEFLSLNANANFNFLAKAVLLEIDVESCFSKVQKTIHPRIDELSKVHSNVTITQELFERFLYFLYSERLKYIDYTRILYGLDYLFSICENSGRKKVRESDIHEFFSGNFVDYYKIDKVQRSRIARHEVGHTILALSFPNYIELLGVRIVGNGDRLGGTLIRLNLSNVYKGVVADENYIVSMLAFFLAGRVLEGSDNLGAIEDLKQAKEQAKNFVMKNGSYDDLGRNYFCDESEKISEKSLEVIEDEVRDLLKKGEDLAKKTLDAEQETIQDLVAELLKRDYLTAKEVWRIWKKRHKKS